MEPVMMDVLEEHLDEAAFFWFQWERALRSSDYELAEAAALEERLLVHVDGLVAGDAAAIEGLLLPALETDESERISAAAFSLLEGNEKRALEETLAVFDSGDSIPRAGLSRALELSARQGLESLLLKRLSTEERALRLLAFQVLAARGALPQETRAEWLYRDDAELVIASLRSPQPLSRELAQNFLPQLLVDPRPGVRAAAITAGITSGSRAAWKACRKVAEEQGADQQQCLVLLAVGGEAQDVEWLAGLLRNEAFRADVLWALGFSGHRHAAEACLEWMGADRVGALAGEAFSAITGLKLEGKYRKVPMEEDALVPLEDEDLDADLVPGPEASLPLPVRDAVDAWWRAARKGFEEEVRYLRGTPQSAEGLVEALVHEPMRRRPVLAHELAIRSRGVHVLQTRDFVWRQRLWLERLRAARGRVQMSPFARLFES